jgi:hypothetical protein
LLVDDDNDDDNVREPVITTSVDSPPPPPALSTCSTSPQHHRHVMASKCDLFSPLSPTYPTLSSPIATTPVKFALPPTPPQPVLTSPAVNIETPSLEEIDIKLLNQARDIGGLKFTGTWADRLKFAQSLGGSKGLIRQFIHLSPSDQLSVRSALHVLLGDLHEKVMVTTLSVLVDEFKNPTLLCESLIEVALPRAAHLVFDKKESIKLLGQQLLNLIRAFSDASFVLKLCMSHLTEGQDKVKQTIIEFATPLIPLAAREGSLATSKCSLLKTTVMRLSVVAVLPEVSNSASKHGGGGGGGPTASRDRTNLRDAAVVALNQLCRTADPVLVVAQVVLLLLLLFFF